VGLQELRGPYSLCKTNSLVVLFAMSFMETLIVLPSEEIVKRMTSTTFPSRLSVSSIVCSSIRLTLGSAKLKVSPSSFNVTTSAFSDRFRRLVIRHEPETACARWIAHYASSVQTPQFTSGFPFTAITRVRIAYGMHQADRRCAQVNGR